MKQILIVDDEKNIRLTMRQALEPLGHEVHTAINGEDALKMLKEIDVDLMLLDLKMPGMDGMEVLKEAVNLRPDLRVIIVTAFGTVQNAVETMKLGAVDFLQKPFAPKEIRDLVNRVLDRSELDESDVSDYESRIELARHFINERKFSTAIEHVKKAVGIDPSRPEAFNLLGVLQEILGHGHEARANYRVAWDLDPTYEPAKKNLHRATSWQRVGSYDLGDSEEEEEDEDRRADENGDDR